MIIGVLAGIIPFFAVAKLKACSVTTTRSTPSACTAWAARWARSSPASSRTRRSTPSSVGVKEGLLMNQIKAILVTLVLSVVATAVIAFIVKAVIGLRPDEEVETVGLDLAEHGEEGYHGA